MKYKISYLLIVLLSICSLTSCLKDPTQLDNSKTNKLNFKLSLPDHAVVETRSGNEDNTINDLHVLVFDGNQDASSLIDLAECSVSGVSYYANLKTTTTSGYIMVLANTANVMNSLENSTLSEVRSKLLIKLTLNNGNIIEDPSLSPMSSELVDLSGGFPVDNLLNVELVRSTAKVTVVNTATTQLDYTLDGANIGNAPTLGYVISGMSEVVAPNIANYAGLDQGIVYSVEKMISSAFIDPSTKYGVSEPLYLFESKKINQTFVIIKGTYKGMVSYHRLNIWDRKTEKYIDIDRNSHYVINIAKIHTGGYGTAQQAIESVGSNRDIDFEIVVTDKGAHDIITNGEQYLSCSNSNFIQYRTGVASYVIVTTINYTVPKGANKWQDGVVTAVGDGLTLSNAITGSEKTMVLPAQDSKNYEIKANFSSEFIKGYIDIRIGDLSKRIKIQKQPTLPAIADEIEFADAIIGDRTEAGASKYNIRFASVSGKYMDKDNYDNIFSSTTDKLFALLSGNVGYRDNVFERQGHFFITSSKDEGRTKIEFDQKKLDVYSSLSQIKPYTYVGTFHRADETAERIIRILPVNPDPKTTWSAIVIVGHDFIELDTGDSPDTGINKYNTYGYDPADPNNQSRWDNPRWTLASDVEANCQFTPEQKGKLSVNGNGDLVYFRVGMKSKLPGGAAAKPRYGLIAVKHAGGNHFIYVRQGEAEDYLMRPGDGILTNGTITSNRPFAKKVHPYNLTVPLDKRNLKFYDIPAKGAALTDYPSKGGYLFQGNSQRAFFPIGSETDVKWVNGSSGSAGSEEICPVGYRRPEDGVSPNTVGNIAGSELRQSFWLSPPQGPASSSFSNMLRGYIADGHYDRHLMRVPNTQGHSDEGVDNTVYKEEKLTINGITTTYTIPTMVGEGSEIGYAGMLVFNPNNYASIFIPGTGSRNGQTFPQGVLRGTGAESNFWSSTNYNVNQMWYLATGYYSSGFVFDCYHTSRAAWLALSIRCIKE